MTDDEISEGQGYRRRRDTGPTHQSEATKAVEAELRGLLDDQRAAKRLRPR